MIMILIELCFFVRTYYVELWNILIMDYYTNCGTLILNMDYTGLWLSLFFLREMWNIWLYHKNLWVELLIFVINN